MIYYIKLRNVSFLKHSDALIEIQIFLVASKFVCVVYLIIFEPFCIVLFPFSSINFCGATIMKPRHRPMSHPPIKFKQLGPGEAMRPDYLGSGGSA